MNKKEKLRILNAMLKYMVDSREREDYLEGLCHAYFRAVQLDVDAMVQLKELGIVLPRKRKDHYCWTTTKSGNTSRIRAIQAAIRKLKIRNTKTK